MMLYMINIQVFNCLQYAFRVSIYVTKSHTPGPLSLSLSLAKHSYHLILQLYTPFKPFSVPLPASRASTCRWKETRWATKSAPSLPNMRRSRRWRSPSPTSSREPNTRPGRDTWSAAECRVRIRVWDKVEGKGRYRWKWEGWKGWEGAGFLMRVVTRQHRDVLGSPCSSVPYCCCSGTGQCTGATSKV